MPERGLLVVVPVPPGGADRRLVLTGTASGDTLLDRALGLARHLLAAVGHPGRPVVVDLADAPTTGPHADATDGTDGTDVVVVHPLCAFADPDEAATLVRTALAEVTPAAAVVPVTDTVKRLERSAGWPVVASTVDRDRLAAAATPVVLPAGCLPRGGWAQLPLDDPASTLVALLAATAGGTRLVPFGGTARRLHDPDDVTVVAAVLAAG